MSLFTPHKEVGGPFLQAYQIYITIEASYDAKLRKLDLHIVQLGKKPRAGNVNVPS